MGEIREAIEVHCAVAQAWSLVSDFVGVLELVGADVEGEGLGVGALRIVRGARGRIVERIETLDADNWRLTYSMPERGLLPVTDYEGTVALRVLDAERTEIAWSSRFRTQDADDAAVTDQLGQVFAGFLLVIKQRLEAPAA